MTIKEVIKGLKEETRALSSAFYKRELDLQLQRGFYDNIRIFTRK